MTKKVVIPMPVRRPLMGDCVLFISSTSHQNGRLQQAIANVAIVKRVYDQCLTLQVFDSDSEDSEHIEWVTYSRIPKAGYWTYLEVQTENPEWFRDEKEEAGSENG